MSSQTLRITKTLLLLLLLNQRKKSSRIRNKLSYFRNNHVQNVSQMTGTGDCSKFLAMKVYHYFIRNRWKMPKYIMKITANGELEDYVLISHLHGDILLIDIYTEKLKLSWHWSPGTTRRSPKSFRHFVRRLSTSHFQRLICWWH